MSRIGHLFIFQNKVRFLNTSSTWLKIKISMIVQQWSKNLPIAGLEPSALWFQVEHSTNKTIHVNLIKGYEKLFKQ